MGEFIEHPQDEFAPNYGGINWKYRLNTMLEASGVEIYPVGYSEGESMQVTQENTIIYINQVADELDCIAVKYDRDNEDVWTWYFSGVYRHYDDFKNTADRVGQWACNIITLYPMEHVVKTYERLHGVPEDYVPDDWIK